MILVTVGTQLPFDRLISAVDRYAADLTEPVFAQIGRSTLRPRNMSWERFVDPVELEKRFAEARLIVAHAGIGTVLSAMRHGKPLVVLPRRASLGEHRNDHQLSTIMALKGQVGIHVARDETELEALLHGELAAASAQSGNERRTRLIQGLSDFIHQR